MPQVVGVPCCCSGSIDCSAVFQFVGVRVRFALLVDLQRAGLDAGVANLLQKARCLAVATHIVTCGVAASASTAAAPTSLVVANAAAPALTISAVAAIEQCLEFCR